MKVKSRNSWNGGKMTEIKFSHKYLKLTGISGKVRLIQIIKIQFSELSKHFIDYDTKYFKDGKFEHYPLPKSGLGILMIFNTYNNKIFMTVRPFNPKKWDYYKKLEGELFDIQYNGITKPAD